MKCAISTSMMLTTKTDRILTETDISPAPKRPRYDAFWARARDVDIAWYCCNTGEDASTPLTSFERVGNIFHEFICMNLYHCPDVSRFDGLPQRLGRSEYVSP